jgi:hypothetical protein
LLSVCPSIPCIFHPITLALSSLFSFFV